MCCCDRLNSETGLRVQLSFIARHRRDLQKCKAILFFSLFLFSLESIVSLHKNVLLMSTCNGFIIVILKE